MIEENNAVAREYVNYHEDADESDCTGPMASDSRTRSWRLRSGARIRSTATKTRLSCATGSAGIKDFEGAVVWRLDVGSSSVVGGEG